MLQVDATLIVQLGLFLTLFYLLNRWVFAPTLEAIALRDRRLRDQVLEAEALRREAEHLEIRHREGLEHARALALRERKQLLEEGLAREESILDEARAHCQGLLEGNTQLLDEEAQRLDPELHSQARDLAGLIVARILGRAALALVLAFGLLAAAPGELRAAEPGPSSASAAQAQDGAAEAAAHTEHSAGVPGLRYWLELGAGFVNLALLLLLLRKVLRPALRSSVQQRRERLVAALADAARQKEEAVDRLANAKEALAGLDEEAAALRRALLVEAAAERDRIVAAAQRQAEQLRKQADLLAAQERRRRRRSVALGMVDQAIRLAEGELATNLGATENRRQVGLLLQQLDAAPAAATEARS